MMKIFVKLLIITLSICKIFIAENVICNSSKIIDLKENEIVFFESPNFPQTIDNETKDKCKLIINGHTKKENMALIFVITNGHPIGGQIFDGEYVTLLDQSNLDVIYYRTDKSNVTFSFTNNEIKKEWEAFQGFITYEVVEENSCPLANKNNSFIFTNETQVLYLRSSYDSFNSQEKQCSWNFLSPDGYAFKVNVLNASSTVLIVTNSSRDFIKYRSAYYYKSNNITVAFTTTIKNDVINDEIFMARISIVSLKNNNSNTYCTSNTSAGITVWQTPLTKFTDNANCRISFVIKSGFQLFAHVTVLETKENVDVLRYYIDEKLLFPVEFETKGLYAFLPYSIKEQRNITFEYKSDESVIYKGFRMEFENVECKCDSSKFVIPCFGEYNFSVMARKDFVYCADLSCHFEIVINESCPNNWILFKVYPEFGNADEDSVQVISNEKVLINTTGISNILFKSVMQSALILPKRNTTLIFNSSSKMNNKKSVSIGKLRLWAISFNDSLHIPSIKITSDEPLYSFKSDEMPENSVLTIKLSEELISLNDSLELVYETSNIQHMFLCITLYNDETMSSIEELSIFSSIVAIGPSVTIYKHIRCQNDLTKFIIRAKNTQSKNCIFQNNIMDVADVMRKNKIISMISGPKNPCELTLINNVGSYAIKQIWCSSEENMISIYNNANRSLPFLELNRNSSSNWKLMTFNALSYLIIIPSNTSFMMELFSPLHNIEFSEPIFSYYESPYYETPSFKIFACNVTYEIALNFEARFTVTDIDLSPSGILQLISSNGNLINFTAIGNSTIANSESNGIVNIFYNEPELGYKGAMISIEIHPRIGVPLELTTTTTKVPSTEEEGKNRNLFGTTAISSSSFSLSLTKFLIICVALNIF